MPPFCIERCIMKEKLLAGKIVNTHGIRGELKAVYYTDSPAFFDTVREVFPGMEEEGLALTASRAHKGAVLLKLDGIDNIEDAERLVGKEIYVDRQDDILSEDRYYIVDIIGCGVYDEDDAFIGEITDVFPTGSNDVFEVQRPNGKTAYIPNIHDIVKNIDISKKSVRIHVIGGLIDDED